MHTNVIDITSFKLSTVLAHLIKIGLDSQESLLDEFIVLENDGNTGMRSRVV